MPSLCACREAMRLMQQPSNNKITLCKPTTSSKPFCKRAGFASAIDLIIASNTNSLSASCVLTQALRSPMHQSRLASSFAMSKHCQTS
eukprot:5754724-Amphidinium_carterae.1